MISALSINYRGHFGPQEPNIKTLNEVSGKLLFGQTSNRSLTDIHSTKSITSKFYDQKKKSMEI